MKTLTIGDNNVQNCTIGPGAPLALIAGPCVIESKDLCFELAQTLKDLT
ncbi:MAG: 3-deoxy-8-phosphooctulonate synthase, partial [Planctomycetes bacterium]|nr:3-deoxy-8-phosphooctulonate synthase [Planctomycetota bacterium]